MGVSICSIHNFESPLCALAGFFFTGSCFLFSLEFCLIVPGSSFFSLVEWWNVVSVFLIKPGIYVEVPGSCPLTVLLASVESCPTPRSRIWACASAPCQELSFRSSGSKWIKVITVFAFSVEHGNDGGGGVPCSSGTAVMHHNGEPLKALPLPQCLWGRGGGWLLEAQDPAEDWGSPDSAAPSSFTPAFQLATSAFTNYTTHFKLLLCCSLAVQSR